MTEKATEREREKVLNRDTDLSNSRMWILGMTLVYLHCYNLFLLKYLPCMYIIYIHICKTNYVC